MEQFDLIVVGAGVFGLPMAKTYLEINPHSRILVLDAQSSVGGTWAAERLYDGLNTNNLVGTLEFSDFPMDFNTFGVAEGSHIPGPVMHRYLTAYAQHFGVWDSIRFGVWVKSAETLESGGWIVRYEVRDGEKVEEVRVGCAKLVMATGSSSVPNMPTFKGSEEFKGSIFHSKELPHRRGEMASADNVVVLGGSKSAADAVYMNASKGRHVDWVIRQSGKGPSWFFSPYVSPLNLQFEKLAMTRIMTLISPVFNDPSPARRLLHNTRLGRACIAVFVALINRDLIQRGRFNAHPDTRKLIPPHSVYWSGTAVGIFNHPTDLFGLIRDGMVHIHRADIASVSSSPASTVTLSDGTVIEAEVLVCATGWELGPVVPILPSHLRGDGMETLRSDDPGIEEIDEGLLARWPILKGSPALLAKEREGEREEEHKSWILYRAMIPPSFVHRRTLAYIGAALSLRGFSIAEVQALWICAFFAGELGAEVVVPDKKEEGEEEARREAVGRNRFSRLLAPMGLGRWGADMVFDTLGYADCLLRDLGVPGRRKEGGWWLRWWREWVSWYGVGDYRGLVGEWVGMRGERGGESG